MRFKIAIILLFIPFFSYAQKNSSTNWMPIMETNFPMRFLTFSMDANRGYGISSTSTIDEIGSGSTEIEANRTAKIKMKFPIVYKPNFILTGSLDYADEKFFFDDEEDMDFPLYVSLEDRNLKKLGSNFNALIHLKGNRSLVVRTNLSLAGDFYRDNSHFTLKKYLKFSLAAGYGIKKNNRLYYGFGIYYGYTFGSPSVYPAIIWTQRFNNNYGLDALLPQSIRLWKKLNEKSFIYSEARVIGDSYTVHLDNSILSKIESLQLRKSSLLLKLGYTHQLNDWVWLEAKLGYTENLNFNISESNFSKGSKLPKPDNDYILKSTVKGAPFIGLSVFISPPAYFIDKLKK